MKEVSFRYADAESPAVLNANLQVAAGDRVGINGLNGSGKSTILDLLMGLRVPSSGVIEWDGLDLRQLDLTALRGSAALVRKVELFDGSILENIRVGRSGVSVEDVRLALEDVELMKEVNAMPEGLLTELTGSQNPFSAGQAQRLMIARAIVGKPRLLVLDEAMENIDASVKRSVLERLTQPTAPWTLILATHDSFELTYCSRVVRIEEGEVFSDV